MEAKHNGAAVETRGLRKSFGGQEVLHGIDLRVAPGETVAVLGQSGTGKSVLLKLIIGLLGFTQCRVRMWEAKK